MWLLEIATKVLLTTTS
nr:unnamed protein product [Callosobruchus chinensis]